MLPAAIGTCLALLGDATLYAVLPTHTRDVGVTVASVGILLSANRFIRLALNGPAGLIYERWRRRPLFIASLLLGALSTAIYVLAQGFWLLLAGRLLWGVAWSGIWVGGNTIVLDVTGDADRGRWVGLYTLFFFLGAASGSLLGGLLTDGLGYHGAMAVNAALTLAGALVAWHWLPETRGRRAQAGSPEAAPVDGPRRRGEFASALTLLAAHRLAVAGILSSTLGIYLLATVGEQLRVGSLTVGVATLTGLALGSNTLIAMVCAPLIGRLSDQMGSRWRTASVGLAPGVAGFGLLAASLPMAPLLGVPLIAVTSGSSQGLATTLIGDLGSRGQSRRLGVLFTVGDLASAVGPPLAYGLMPHLGIRSIYLMVAGLLVGVLVLMWRQAGRAGECLTEPADEVQPAGNVNGCPT